MSPYLKSAAVAAALSACAAPAYALMTVNIAETGGNVVLSYSGSLNLSGYTSVVAASDALAWGYIVPSAPSIGMLSGADFNIYTFDDAALDPWVAIGTGTGMISTSFSGDQFLFESAVDYGEGYAVVVSSDYEDGDALSGQVTFFGQTLSGLGVTAGVYDYALPSDLIRLTVAEAAAVPLPAAAPLLVAALGGLGLLRRRAKG